jgi:hypothetical protein
VGPACSRWDSEDSARPEKRPAGLRCHSARSSSPVCHGHGCARSPRDRPTRTCEVGSHGVGSFHRVLSSRVFMAVWGAGRTAGAPFANTPCTAQDLLPGAGRPWAVDFTPSLRRQQPWEGRVVDNATLTPTIRIYPQLRPMLQSCWRDMAGRRGCDHRLCRMLNASASIIARNRGSRGPTCSWGAAVGRDLR